ncbi:hypothetical protein Ga0100231_001475 [Opitutaceae bacterium TAV4]|nr:hypothetical protein Ga0100231_001475 [Opitutaceae bacterium TAV4]RRK01549.1 hypothetical protein Ga0100230_006710 [Opitutaceae bacterium TAV3]
MSVSTSYKTNVNRRPCTAAEVAAWAHDLPEFSLNLTDWLHEFRHVHSRAELTRRVAERPRACRKVFAERKSGGLADALLAAHVAHLCLHAGTPVPEWVSATPALARPWFQGGDAEGHNASALDRIDALRFAPACFRAFNVFYVPVAARQLFKKRAGRPTVPASEQRAKAAERQRRYRQRLLHDAGRGRSRKRLSV